MKKLNQINTDDGIPVMQGQAPLPRRIAQTLMARIFVGELKPGDRLPPDRVLAQQLGVDRTSLRAALSELASRNIVCAVRGSRVVVLDYREHAGLDLLDAVFDMPGIDLGSAFNLELLDHWIKVMPVIVKEALRRSTPADLAFIDMLFVRQLDLLTRRAANKDLAVIEVQIQDEIVRLAGSTILRLFANSMRRFRLRFSTSFFNTINVYDHVTAQRALLNDIMAGKVTPEEVSGRYREYLEEHTKRHRENISRLPSNPSLRTEQGQDNT